MENNTPIKKAVITTIIIAGTASVQSHADQVDANETESIQAEKIELATDIVEAGLQSGIMKIGKDGVVKIEKSLFQKLKERGILQNSKMDMSSRSGNRCIIKE